jgi:chromosome segregation and condensation protein ScpB
MNEGITQEDIQMLVAENPLAAEQLRRIMAERQRQELQTELDELKATADHLGISPNGVEKLDQVPAEA